MGTLYLLALQLVTYLYIGVYALSQAQRMCWVCYRL